MPQVFLDGRVQPVLLLHALAAVALLFACSHQALLAAGLWRGRGGSSRLLRFYPQVIGMAFVAAFGLGLLLYPHYRVHVRGLYLDRVQPWASNLFDMKESLVALGLPLALALFALGRRFDAQEDRALVPWLAAASLALWALVAFGAACGVIVTSVRGL